MHLLRVCLCACLWLGGAGFVQSQNVTLQAAYMVPLAGPAGMVGVAASKGHAAAWNFSSQYVGGVQMNSTTFDNMGLARYALLQTRNAISGGSVIVDGSLGSLTGVIGYVTALEGIVQVSCCSSSQQLSNKEAYPTLVRLYPQQVVSSFALEKLFEYFMWDRAAVISTDDLFGENCKEAFLGQFESDGHEVLAAPVVSYDISRSYFAGNQSAYADKFYKDQIQTALSSLRDQGAKIIYTCMNVLDARVVMEMAYDQGMLGNSKYQWVGNHLWGNNALLDGWVFAQKNPDAVTGLMLATVGCEYLTEQFQTLLDRLRVYNSSMQPYSVDPATCLAFDAAVTYLTALNRTLRWIDNINANKTNNKTIKYTCLVSVEREGPPSPECSTPEWVQRELLANASCGDEGVCTENTTRCGVCKLMYLTDLQQQLIFMAHTQAILLSEIYATQSEGSTGPIAFDPSGDRMVKGLRYIVYNARPLENDNIKVRFQNIGLIATPAGLGDFKLTFTKTPIFAGGTATQPNYVPPDDIEIYTKSVALMAVLGTLSAILLVFAIAMGVTFYVMRHVRVIKASSPPLMYVIAFGCCLDFIGVFFLLPPATRAMCTVNKWLHVLGYFLTTLALILKTYRIKAVFTNKMSSVPGSGLKDKYLLLRLLGLISVAVIILICFSIWSTSIVQTTEQNGLRYTYCGYAQWSMGLYIVTLFVTFYSLFLVFQIRGVPVLYNEGKWITIAVYNMVVTDTIVFLILYFTQITPDIRVTIQAVASFLSLGAMVFLLMLPKLWLVYRGKGNRDPGSYNASTAGGSHNTHSGGDGTGGGQTSNGSNNNAGGAQNRGTGGAPSSFGKCLNCGSTSISLVYRAGSVASTAPLINRNYQRGNLGSVSNAPSSAPDMNGSDSSNGVGKPSQSGRSGPTRITESYDGMEGSRELETTAFIATQKGNVPGSEKKVNDVEMSASSC